MVTRDVQENALVRVGIAGQCFLVLSELAGKKKRRDKKWERRFLRALVSTIIHSHACSLRPEQLLRSKGNFSYADFTSPLITRHKLDRIY